MPAYKLYLLIIVLFLGYGHLKAKQPNIDSLLNELEATSSDADRADILIQLAQATYYNEPKRGRSFAEETFSISEQLGDPQLKAESMLWLSKAQFAMGDYDLAKTSAESCAESSQQIDQIERLIDANLMIGRINYVTGKVDSAELFYQNCRELSDQAGYKNGAAQALLGLGAVAENRGDNDQAMAHFQTALEIYLKSGDKEGEMITINKIGIMHEYRGELGKALTNYLEYLRLAEQLEDWESAGNANTNIASLYHIQKNYDKSLEYAQKGMEYYQKIDNQRGIAFIYHDVGNTLKAQRKLDEALESFKKALAIRETLNDKRGQSFTYFAMAWNYKHQGDMQTARANMRKSLALREEIGYNSGIHACQRTLAKWNMEEKNYAAAYPYLQESYEWNKKRGNAEGIWESLNALVEYYEATGDIKNAFAHQKLSMAARDSIFNFDQNKQFAEMQTLYETEKKDKELLEQENNILKLENTNARIEKQRNYIIGGFAFLSIFGYLMFYFNKIRKERNDKIAFAEALIFTQEEERKRIARELHDGIGQSLLLIKKQLASTHEVNQENQQLIADTLEEVRSISRDLHPFQLEKFGLVETIKSSIDKINKMTDVFTTHELEDVSGLFDARAEINLYRILQESLNNVIKHAEATAAKVTLHKHPEFITLSIKDNGKGFDHELAILNKKSMGLRTLNERVQSLGGKLKIEKVNPTGSHIFVQIPYSKSKNAA
jgi:signal transduction histidine kinase